jgi:hypothetical protein
MDTKDISASRTTALAHVGPDRRRFLGMLLAGAAAAPLFTSAALAQAAGDKSDPGKSDSGKKSAIPAKMTGQPPASKSPSDPAAAKSQPAPATKNKSASAPAAHKSPDKGK